MIRRAAVLLLLAAAAHAGDTVALVDGRTIDATLIAAGGESATLLVDGEPVTVPTAALVRAEYGAAGEPPPPVQAFNLFLVNGDRVAGRVTGEGAVLRLDHGELLQGFRVPLSAVAAVRFGNLLPGAQEKYLEAFERARERGRDTVLVERGTRPFPVGARVLEVRERSLLVRIGEQKKELSLSLVYGFVRRAEAPPAANDAIRLRVVLATGGAVTFPLEKIDATAIAGGGTVLSRAAAARIDFTGPHVGHLSDFDPIRVEETALFGDAPKWRRDGMVHGGPLQLDGRVHVKGVGVAAPSRLEFVLGKRWKRFFVRCGIDDQADKDGEARFRVVGDGQVLKEVACTRRGRPVRVLLDVSGVDRLVLETVAGERHVSDFCDWAEARVFNADTSELALGGR